MSFHVSGVEQTILEAQIPISEKISKGLIYVTNSCTKHKHAIPSFLRGSINGVETTEFTIAKLIFLVKLFLNFFLFLENLQNGFLVFLVSAFDQKLQRETYTQFSDFHDFRSKSNTNSLRKW